VHKYKFYQICSQGSNIYVNRRCLFVARVEPAD
jgi:hypothetical protein